MLSTPALDAAKAASANDQQSVMDASMDRLLRLTNATINLPEEVFVSEFADGAFAQLDPFSTMIWPYETPDFQKMTKGGIRRRWHPDRKSDTEGNLKVVTPLEDSPAFHAGIKAGYVITKIDGKKALHMPLDVAVKLITGEIGTSVRLTMRDRAGNESDFNLQRETIKVESIKGYTHKSGGGWDYMVDPIQKIAYVRPAPVSPNQPATISTKPWNRSRQMAPRRWSWTCGMTQVDCCRRLLKS